ncbi:hypothetical protein B0H19DRAFT_1070912 [Mycena capillaripes]|nr:hypothetical protein B0H19DRAFT_1070912 [Mycena capillaripes]
MSDSTSTSIDSISPGSVAPDTRDSSRSPDDTGSRGIYVVSLPVNFKVTKSPSDLAASVHLPLTTSPHTYFHWAVCIGGFVHELVRGENGIISYGQIPFIEHEWYTQYYIGETTMTDEQLVKKKLLVTGARRFDRLLGILVESAKMGGLLACSIGFAAALYGPMGIIWGTWVIVATKIEEAKDRPALHFSVGSAYDHCSI